MKKILFIHNTSAIGGASYCMLNIIKELDRSEFEPIVLVPSNGPLVDALKTIGVESKFLSRLRGVPYNRSLWKLKFLQSYLLIIPALLSFAKFLRENKFDLVYCNSMVLYPYLYIAKKYGAKTVIHVREHWPLCEHTKQLAIARNVVYKCADKVLAINKYSASIFPKTKDKCTIVYDWIDMSNRYEYRLYDDIFGCDSSKLKVFLYTGGFDKFKGPKEVIQVFSSVNKDPNSRLLVMGEKPLRGDDSYFNECIDLIERDNRIYCIPRTYMMSHIIEQAYCVLSFFTIPHANLGMAENIILNKITIAADNEEAQEYSLNGKLAVLFKANDINDFADKLSHLNNVYENIQNALKNESYIIREMFDKSANVEKVKQSLNIQ